jgi:hypothetical protein
MQEGAASWLIYHPQREHRSLDGRVVHCDGTSGNQDPYIWADCFLHTYCHMSQLRAAVGGIHLWVSGDAFPDFRRLYCDLVFVVAEKRFWPQANHIACDDPIVDSPEAFGDHYRWHGQHPYARRRRYTLKADPERSFQPQTADGDLIDVVPLLEHHAITLENLRAGLRAGFASRPITVSTQTASAVAAELRSQATNHLTGQILRRIRLRHHELASPGPDGRQKRSI